MTCHKLLIDHHEVEAHLIRGATYAPARAVAEGCGALVYWDEEAKQAHVVPGRAPSWTAIAPLPTHNSRWRPTYQMHQARLDFIWGHSLRQQVDPRLMVAILLHEGTGSFNTNPSNADQFNGHGPDADWIADIQRAVSHVAGKLAWYSQALAAGFAQACQMINCDGTAIQFIGWPGPIWDHTPDWGCYAQHADWWRGVTSFYQELGGDVRLLSDHWQNARVAVPPLALRCEPVTDNPHLCSDLSGARPRPGVVTYP